MTQHEIPDQSTTLVLGGTGKTGRRVVALLQGRDLPVRVGSRSGAPPFDWASPDVWAPAVEGASEAYVSFFPDLAVSGAAETIARFWSQAVAAGTRRLVMLSGRDEVEAQRAERALQQSGAEWPIVRCSWFNQNFSESFCLDPILPGQVGRLLRYLLTGVLDGRNSHLSDGVPRALGREPRDFVDYAREAAATGVWNAD